MTHDVEGVRALRDNVRRVLDEDLSKDHLRPIWTQVKAEWLGFYPHTRWIVDQVEKRTPHRPDIALKTLLETMDRFCVSQDTAAEHRAESTRLKEAISSLEKLFGHLNVDQG